MKRMLGERESMNISGKIGLSTLHIKNYGSILQCYATKTFLEKEGYECILLDLKENRKIFSLNTLKKFIRLAYDSIVYRQYLKNWFYMKKSMKKDSANVQPKTLENMNVFVNKYLEPRDYTWNQLKKLSKNPEYIAFITGSDQVWNLSRKLNPLFFLEFCSREKRIAFSVSCGVYCVPNFNIKSFAKKLKLFDRISVREESIIKPIEELSGIHAIRLADPTLLLSKEEWLELLGKKCKYENYIFVHFLNEPSQLAIDCINQHNTEGLKVICLGYYYTVLNKIKNIDYVDGGPGDYITLINSAKRVYTDSFHTTLFSINFNKIFYCFERQYSHQYPQTSRIMDLLNRFNLKNRFITDLNSNCSQIDYLKINHILKKETKNIQMYLKDELNKRKNGN